MQISELELPHPLSLHSFQIHDTCATCKTNFIVVQTIWLDLYIRSSHASKCGGQCVERLWKRSIHACTQRGTMLNNTTPVSRMHVDFNMLNWTGGHQSTRGDTGLVEESLENFMAFEKRRILARSLEALLLVAIIVVVWLVMTLPVVIYFLVSDGSVYRYIWRTKINDHHHFLLHALANL